jgi:hypothetical protein
MLQRHPIATVRQSRTRGFRCMNYINPIEILRLQAVETSSIDNSVIKKAKKKLFADIELSDSGYLDYYKEHQLTRSDCERVIDELEEKKNIGFYSYLASNRQLNEFLVNGNYKILSSFKQESIYKQPEFVDFVSPYFSKQLDRVLLKLFQDDNLELLAAALKTEFLLNQSGLNNAYRSLGNEIQRRIDCIDEITESIKEEYSDYTDSTINKVIKIVKKHFPIDLLNVLPKFFQSLINKIAKSINQLQLAIYYGLDAASVLVKLSDYLLKLEIDSIDKTTFEENYVQFKKNQRESIKRKKYESVLKEWAEILLSIQSKIKEVKEGRLRPITAYQFVKNSLKIEELNELPTFATEIRVQIAESIGGIAIAGIEKRKGFKNVDLSLFRLALKIKLPNEDELRIREFADFIKVWLEKKQRKSEKTKESKKRSWWERVWGEVKENPYLGG